MKTALVCGAGGFIGGHLAARLKKDGYWVRGADAEPNRYQDHCDDFIFADLRDRSDCRDVIDQEFDEIYQCAADMGGAGYVFTGEADADIMRNNVNINLSVLEACRRYEPKRVFFSSSACVYPQGDDPNCAEASAYPANPDSDYGFEKLFAERLYSAYARNYGLRVRIGRYHNVFGPMGTWCGGREKAPAALCRKVAEAPEGGSIELWGDGQQTRSFLYIDECIEGTVRLMRSGVAAPVNIGSDEMVTLDALAGMVMECAGKHLEIEHIPGPLGVRGRNSDNRCIERVLGWKPSQPLHVGLAPTYAWIAEQVAQGSTSSRL